MTLRIDIRDERDCVVFTLMGRIETDQLAELQTLLKTQVSGHNLVLDLKAVNLVDRDVVRFLAQTEVNGARLRNCSAFIREWISQERKGMQDPDAGQEKIRLLSKGRKILLIEDSQFMRIAIDRALTAAGYTVKTAVDGDAGLKMTRDMRPDLILLDMMLPKTPGLEVLRALRKDSATASIPVIVLTTLSERDEKILLAEGASGYLDKSEKLFENDATILVDAIETILTKTSSER